MVDSSSGCGLLSLPDELIDHIASYLPALGTNRPGYYTTEKEFAPRWGDDGWFHRVQDLRHLHGMNRRLSLVLKPRLFRDIMVGRSYWGSDDMDALLHQPQLLSLVRYMRVFVFYNKQYKHEDKLSRLINQCAALQMLVMCSASERSEGVSGRSIILGAMKAQ